MLITEWALFRQSLPCPQVAAAAAASSCVDFVCIFFTSNSYEWVWALVLQSLPCSLITLTAILFIITSTGCRRPPVWTSMLVMSKTTPLVTCFAAALRASSFGLLRYSVNMCAFCFSCCCGTPLVVCFAAALRASSFGLLRYSFNRCAFCFCCCCGIFSFRLIFCIISCVMYFIFFFGGGFFFIVTIIS